jgi:outer membrane receptor protein involved in Fe transport
MKKVANAALSYEWKKKGEVRVAYSYRDAYLLSLSALSPWLNQGWASYGQWDVSGRYRITKALHFDASVRNLTGVHRVHTRGEKLQLLHEDVDSGRSIWIGITYRH